MLFLYALSAGRMAPYTICLMITAHTCGAGDVTHRYTSDDSVYAVLAKKQLKLRY